MKTSLDQPFLFVFHGQLMSHDDIFVLFTRLTSGTVGFMA